MQKQLKQDWFFEFASKTKKGFLPEKLPTFQVFVLKHRISSQLSSSSIYLIYLSLTRVSLDFDIVSAHISHLILPS